MTSSLDDFFKQIIHSEQKAQARKNLINEVKEKSGQLQEEVSEAEHEHKSHQGQLVIKIQQWNETELQVKWLTTKVEVLTQQRDVLKAENQSLCKQLSEIEENTSEMGDVFCQDVRSFCQGYDLVSGGQAQRHLLAQKEIEQLQEEQHALEKEVKLVEEKLQTVAELKGKKQQLEQHLRKSQQNIDDLDCELQKEKEDLASMQDQHRDMLQVPHTDPDFLRLQGELELCRQSSLEGRCAELQVQLEQLEQQQWQQTLQSKRRPPTTGAARPVQYGQPQYKSAGSSQPGPGVQMYRPRQQYPSNTRFHTANQVAGISPSSVTMGTQSSTFTAPSPPGSRDTRGGRPNIGKISWALKQQPTQGPRK